MKIDEIIIKLCSERGYDPSQVNDYPTLLEQLECIKELLKTYPNQQYYTVKAYTYTESTKKFSFKISNVNNYGRQINIGDILIVTLANNILEIAQISSLDVEAGNGIADDVGQLTGSKGDIGPQGPRGLTGETGPKGDNGLSALTYGSLITVQTKPQVGQTFSWAPMFSSGFNRNPVVGDVLNVLVNYKSNADSYMCTIKVTEYTSPTLKGTYVNVTEATGKVGNTFKLAIGTCDITSDSARQNVIGKLIYNIPAYTGQNVDAFMETISSVNYIMCTGYITYNNVTETVIGADSYASSDGGILIYTPTHNIDAGGITAFITSFDPNFISYN